MPQDLPGPGRWLLANGVDDRNFATIGGESAAKSRGVIETRASSYKLATIRDVWSFSLISRAVLFSSNIERVAS